jgi:hypothetical protein
MSVRPPATPADIATPSTSSSREPADRVRFETLITDISARLIGTPPEQVHATIEAALEDVRTFFQADRVLLLQVSEDGTFANVATPAPRSLERRPNTARPALAAVPSARRSTARSSSTACSQEHEAATASPDLQSGREFRDRTGHLRDLE